MVHCKECEFFSRIYDSSGRLMNTVCNRHEFEVVEEDSGTAYEVGEVDTKPYRKACEDFSKKEKQKGKSMAQYTENELMDFLENFFLTRTL